MTLMQALKAPFPEKDIEWRLAQCGKSGDKIWAQCLAYIQARAVMDRLDEVVGPERWRVNYNILPSGVICKLGVEFAGTWVDKEDGSDVTDIEAFKGGISSALKRAGSAWGVGRYLYDLEAGFAEIVEKKADGARYGKTKEGAVFYWHPPKLPAWALPPIQTAGLVHPIPMPPPQVTVTTSTAIGGSATKPVVYAKSSIPNNVPRMAPLTENFGEWICTFGKYKNKSLEQIGFDNVINYIEWLRRSDKPSEQSTRFIERAELWLKGFKEFDSAANHLPEAPLKPPPYMAKDIPF